MLLSSFCEPLVLLINPALFATSHTNASRWEASNRINEKHISILFTHSPLYVAHKPVWWTELCMLMERSRRSLWGAQKETPPLLFLYLTWRALSSGAETAGPKKGVHNQLKQSKIGTLVWRRRSLIRLLGLGERRLLPRKSGKAGQWVRVIKLYCAIECHW